MYRSDWCLCYWIGNTIVLKAACNNTNFAPPTRLEFHKVMKETLRTAQERCRNRNKHKTTSVAIR